MNTKQDNFRQLLPIAGILSALLLAAAIFGTPSAPQVEKGNHAEVVAFYHDNASALQVTNIPIALLAAFFFIALLTELRATLRSGEAGESTYSTLAVIGGTIVAIGLPLMAMSSTIVASAADLGFDDNTVLTLALGTDWTWMPWVVGMAALQWAVGLGGLRTATLPKWLSWVSIVLGALCLTGLGGIGVFMVQPLWLLAVSVVLLQKQRAEVPTRSPISASAPV